LSSAEHLARADYLAGVGVLVNSGSPIGELSALSEDELADAEAAAAAIQPHRCFAHTAHLIVQHDLAKIPAVSDIFNKLREQRRGFNDSELSELQAFFYPAQFFGTMSPEVRKDWSRRSKLSAMVYDAMGPEYFGNETVKNRLDLRPDLGKLKGIPTLVIGGKMDIVTPPSVVRTYAEGIPGAKLELFDNCGHYPFVEHEEKFLAMVNEFLGQ